MRWLALIFVLGCNSYTVDRHRPIAQACPTAPTDIGGPSDCVSDADCGSEFACACAGSTFDYGAGTVNICVPAGCHSDADCSSGFCSPSFDTCGRYGGTKLYACHTSDDECGNDGDCGAGACEFSPEANHWVCDDRICAG